MKPLSTETVRRALRSMDPYETTKARYGPRVARKLHGQFREQIRADAPLNRVYMDHTQLDVYVRVRVSRLRWTAMRPYLTLVSDDATGRVLGYALSFKAPKAEDVLAALRHAILPKAYTERWVGTWLTFAWDVMGLIDELVIDNGMDLQALAVYAACLSVGISITTCPPLEPWRRGRAERLFGTLNTKLIHTMEGTTLGRKDNKKHEHDPKAFATWDMDQLHIGLHVVFEKMATEWHKGLEDYPIRRWKEGVAKFPVLLPRSREEFDAQLSLRYEYSIGSMGIEFHGLYFTSPELTALKRRLGSVRKVTVLVRPEDIREVLVVDPQTLTTIPVTCTKEFADPLPLFIHMAQRGQSSPHRAKTPANLADESLAGTDAESVAVRNERLSMLHREAERKFREDQALTDRLRAHDAAVQHRGEMQAPKPAPDSKAASALLGMQLLGARPSAPTLPPTDQGT